VVRVQRELILRRPGDLPLGGRDGGVLPHGHSGARLGVARDLGPERLRRPQSHRGLRTAAERASLAQLQQRLAEPLVQGQRRVAGRVDPTSDAGIHLSQRDLVGCVDHRLQAGSARLLQVDGGRTPIELGAQHDLAREVEIPAVLENRTRGDLADARTGQPEAGDQAVEGGTQHVRVGGLGVRAVGAREGDPVAAEDADPS
jgi:hypothetical protein